jgi:hypothetical protein
MQKTIKHNMNIYTNQLNRLEKPVETAKTIENN